MDEVQEGEDGYSDDALDALPADAFDQLQQNAIRSTQQPNTERFPLPSLHHYQAKVPANVSGGLGRLSVGENNLQHASTQDYPQQPSSDYGDFEDEMLDGEIFDAAEQPAIPVGRQSAISGALAGDSTQREQWRQQRFGGASQVRGYPEPRPFPPTIPHGGLQSETGANRGEHYHHEKDERLFSQGVESLQAQILELRRERKTLQQAVESANANASSKAGEIAIVRANQAKLEKESDKRLMALQKLHAEDAARQRIEVDKARLERQQIETQKRFLENELARETEQVKSLHRAVKSGGGKDSEDVVMGGAPTTPRKNKALYGDGFDDDEIQIVSPAKLTIRSKQATPKGGAKRKRIVESSPAQPLQLSEPKKDALPEDVPEDHSNDPPKDTVLAPRRQDHRFEFTQKVLNHRIELDGKRTFEALADFAFPSKPETTLSSLFLDQTSTLSVKTDIENFEASFGLIIVSLWQQCINETFYGPVHLLTDLIKFILLISPPDTAKYLTNDLVLLVQNTADFIMIPRIKQTAPVVRIQIDPKECLEILHLMAYNLYRVDDITRFWRRMRFDFTGMLLNILQPIEEMQITVSLLRTSVLDTSFAMRVPENDGDQGKSEAWILYLLSRWLIDVRRLMDGEEPYDVIQVCEIRQQILSLMEAMCNKKHGGEALAKDPVVIGRLVVLINEELSSLYDFQYGHEHRSTLVNQATRLLFYLTSTFSELINIQDRLRQISGGTHKYLIILARLAFSEGFYEKGIEDDVVECATEMLENLITPEEGEELLEAFSSARRC